MAFVVTQRPDPPVRQSPGRWTAEEIIADIQRWVELHGALPRHCDWNSSIARRRDIPFEYGWPSPMPVVKHFGSWEAGMRAAGFEPRGLGCPVVERPCANCGEPFPSRGGTRCKRCYAYWHRTGEEWSEERAAEGRRRPGEMNRARWLERIARLIEYRRQGRSNVEIAEIEGVSQAAIGNAFSNAKRQGFAVPRAPFYKN